MVRARENVGQRAEQSITLENFRGVDLTSSPLRVDPRRAVRCRNLLPYGGRNVKRRGWRQEAIFREYDTETGQNVHQPVRGMWWYVYSEGDTKARFLLVHAGTRLYISRDDGIFVTVSDRMGNGASEAFVIGRRIYLVGHPKYYVYGTWDQGETFELREVADDEDTYIPRTTIAINPTTNEEGETVKDTRRGLDAVNLLCSKRINSCMGRAYGNKIIKLWLDAPCVVHSEVRIEVETVGSDDKLKTEVWHTEPYDIPEIGEGTVVSESGEVKGHFYYSQATAGGQRAACLTVTADCPPPIEGRDNITITFTPANAPGSARIDGCRFGVMFGGGGNANRLFLSGNPDHPNLEFYSYWRDPTYFPDNGWNAVGSDAAAVVGFSRVSDGVLATFKEEGRGDPVIYYHTAEDVPVYIDDSEKELEAMKFRLYTDAGNAGEGMISRMASVDFYGDPLILSGNGVFGLTYKTNVETADRYAAERSRNIRADMLHRNLSHACGAVFEGKYWLAVDGVCYVADAGYTFRPSEGTSGYQYEWWYLDHIPASVMCVADGKLYFGTEDGRVCYFLPEGEAERGADGYRDISWEYLLPATIDHDADDLTRLTVADEAHKTLREGDRISVEAPAYALLLDTQDYTVEDGTVILAEPDSIADWQDGATVYADMVGESGLAESVPYTVGDIDRGWGTFKLFGADGAAVLLSGRGFRLGVSLNGSVLHVVELIPDEEDGVGGFIRVSGHESGKPMTMMRYGENGYLNNLYGKIIHVDTVSAEWYTPVLDFGDKAKTKTLTGMTVATEPGSPGRVSFGYETRAVTRLAAQVSGMGGMDFTNLDFNEFSLSAFASAWTVKINERNINYIAFRWFSEEPSDCRVDSLVAHYKLTGDIRGGL